MAVVNNHVFVLLVWIILFTSHTHAQPRDDFTYWINEEHWPLR